jgi:hypothetical protein
MLTHMDISLPSPLKLHLQDLIMQTLLALSMRTLVSDPPIQVAARIDLLSLDVILGLCIILHFIKFLWRCACRGRSLQRLLVLLNIN